LDRPGRVAAASAVGCYSVWTRVDGDVYWDLIDYDRVHGYVSAYRLYTAGDITTRFCRAGR
jgi:hypothetical protein